MKKILQQILDKFGISGEIEHFSIFTWYDSISDGYDDGEILDSGWFNENGVMVSADPLWDRYENVIIYGGHPHPCFIAGGNIKATITDWLYKIDLIK